jgi:predicted P-loop ATPase
VIDHVVISALRDKHDSAPRRTKVPWSKFIEAFQKIRRTTCLVANCKHHLCVHKNGRAWSPAVYPPNAPRQKNFVEEVSLLVVDLDHLTNEQLAAALVPLAPYQRIIHASHSDRPAGSTICTCGSEPGALHGQGCPSRVDRCVRSILMLNRPVKGSEWGRFWPTAMAHLKQPADPSTCDANRLYYLPSRPKDAETYYFEAHDGIALDVEAILAIAPPEAPSIAENLRVDPAGVVEPGQRHAMLKSLAGSMRFRGCGYETIESALLAANKAQCNPPKSNAEVKAIARWAAAQPITTLPRDGQTSNAGDGDGDDSDDEPDFIRDKQGHPYNTQWNIEIAIRRLGVQLRYDEFSGDEIVEGLPGYGARFDDPATINLRLKIDATFHFLPGRELFRDITSNIARRNRFHPVRDYLDSLAWDQEPRIERWLIDYAGAPDTPYVRAVSRIVLIAAARRIRRPGAKYDEMLILESPQGTEKCLRRGTRVLMYDGSSRAVEDVRAGDLLLGPDSAPRRVLETTRGVGSLRRIVPTKGAEWVCNDKHILTVALHEKCGYHDAPVTDFVPHKWGSRHVPSNKYAMQVRSPEIYFPRRPVPIEPYLLGLWLGDGTCGKPEITNTEPEVHAYCREVAPKYNVEYKCKTSNHDCPIIVLTGHGGNQKGVPNQYRRGKPHPLLTVFKRCIVDGEKRIPHEYLANDAETRLALLAGLIDTDGHLDRCNVFNIATKWAGLRDDILFLARSLGFAAYSHLAAATIKSLGFSGQYHVITISGHIERVPVKVPRKKASPRRQVKDVLRTGFRVEAAGIGEFFGFELDGDGRFLLDDFTITHNSSGLRALAFNDDWFTDDLPLHGDTRRFMEATAGKWIVEAGELKGMGKGDVAALKACLSRQHDEARLAYGHKSTRVPRQFVLIGTTNETDGYLRDATGNRRFWPVRILRFDLDRLRADRDQLWAEAAVAEAAGESIRLDPRLYAEAAIEQEARQRGDDPLVDVLHRWLGNRTGKLRVSDAYLICGIEPGKVNQDQIERFGRAIRELGWERQRRRFDGALQYAYVKGSTEQREVELIVEYDPHLRSVRIEVSKPLQTPTTN